MSTRVFLVDDHKSILWGVQRLIESDDRYEVCGTATTADECIQGVKQTQPNVVLLDLDIGDGEAQGLDMIPHILNNSPAKIIVFTGVRDHRLHDRAVVQGARGVMTKDESPETLLRAIELVDQGELWLNRNAASRILMEIVKSKAEKDDPPPEQKRLSTLTAKETTIVKAVTEHSTKNLKQVAALLNISEHTLRNHLATIYDKLQVGSRLELYVFYTNHKQH